MRKIMLSFYVLFILVLISCKEVNPNSSKEGELCFDTTIYKKVYSNDKIVVLEKKIDEKERLHSFLAPIDKTTASLMVKNYNDNNSVIKSVFVDFPMDADNIGKVYDAAGENGKFRIYFGAYEAKGALLKNPKDPNFIMNRQTVLLVPVDASGNENLKSIVNLGSLCPPEDCNLDLDGKYKAGTLAKEAKLLDPKN